MGTPAGQLRDRVVFATFGTTDGEGGTFRGGEPVEQCTLWADVLALNGGEEVMAGRVAGRRTVVFTVRQNSESAAITSAWVAWDKRRPKEVFNVREVKPSDNGREFYEILCESGVSA